MKMTKTTGWSLGTTGLCVAIAAGSWFGLVDPQRAAAAESREQTVAAQDTNAQLEIRIAQLEQEFADLPARQAELAQIRLALPEEAALAQLIRDLTAAGVDAGANLDSVTSGAPVAVVDPAAAVVAPEEATGTDPAAGTEPSAAPSTEPTPSPSGDPSAPADPAAAGTAPVAPAAGPVLAAIPVTITVSGDFAASTLFLKNIQADMPRALLVDSLALTEATGDDDEAGTVMTVVTGRVFAFVDPTEIPVLPEPTTSPEPSTEPSDG